MSRHRLVPPTPRRQDVYAAPADADDDEEVEASAHPAAAADALTSARHIQWADAALRMAESASDARVVSDSGDALGFFTAAAAVATAHKHPLDSASAPASVPVDNPYITSKRLRAEATQLPDMQESQAAMVRALEATQPAGAAVPPGEDVRTWDSGGGTMRHERQATAFETTTDFGHGGPIDVLRPPWIPIVPPHILQRLTEAQRVHLSAAMHQRSQRVYEFMMLVTGGSNELSAALGATTAPAPMFYGMDAPTPTTVVGRPRGRLASEPPVGGLTPLTGPVGPIIGVHPATLTREERQAIAGEAQYEQQTWHWLQSTTMTGMQFYSPRYFSAVTAMLGEVVQTGVRRTRGRRNPYKDLTVDNLIFDDDQIMRKYAALCSAQINLIRALSGVRQIGKTVIDANNNNKRELLLWFEAHLEYNEGAKRASYVDSTTRHGAWLDLATVDIGDQLFSGGDLPVMQDLARMYARQPLARLPARATLGRPRARIGV